MSSTTSTVESNASNHVRTTQLARSGILAALAASVANVLVLELAFVVVEVPLTFKPLPLGWGPVVASSAVGAVGATVMYGVIAYYSRQPNRTFTYVAVAVLVLSYANFLSPALASAPVVVYAILGLMHVTAAVTIVWVLRRTPRGADDVAEGSQ